MARGTGAKIKEKPVRESDIDVGRMRKQARRIRMARAMIVRIGATGDFDWQNDRDDELQSNSPAQLVGRWHLRSDRHSSEEMSWLKNFARTR